MAWNARIDKVAPFRVMSLLETAQAREAAGHDAVSYTHLTLPTKRIV